jgi:inner membrane protein
MAWFAAVSLVADADFVLVALGAPKDSIWGHRGVSHSLLLAVVAGVVCAWVARRWGQKVLQWGVMGFAVYTSHLVFDCLNVGSLGVPWFWPLSWTNFTIPWSPIPSVRTASEFLTPLGLPVLAAEVVLFAPFWIYALVLRRGPAAPGAAQPVARSWRPRGRVQRAVEQDGQALS